MSRTLIGILGIAVVFFTTGCGKGLSDGERTRFQETLASMANVNASARSVQTEYGLGASAKVGVLGLAAPILEDAGVSILGVTKPRAKKKDAVQKMASALQEATKKGHCDFRFEGLSDRFEMPEPGAESSKMTFFLAIRGPQGGNECPIDLVFKMEMEIKNESTIEGSFEWRYKILDEEYKKMNDVDEISLAGPISVNVQADEESFKTTASLEFLGHVNSQKEGKIGFSVSQKYEASGTEGSVEAKGEWKLKAAYADGSQSAEFKVKYQLDKGKSTPTVEMFEEGRKITDEDEKKKYECGIPMIEVNS